jgi:hypothetical protein
MITQLKNGHAAARFDNSAQNVWKFMVHLVADAVQVEPVSTANSLLTGKRTGNFAGKGV